MLEGLALIWEALSPGLAWFFGLLLWLLPVALWCVWWLWGCNWKHVWPVLARGGWVVLALLMFAAALAWASASPSSWDGLVFMTVSNFWWQLGAVGGLTALALFCGWVQGRMGWAPAEVSFDPPAAAGHDHGHGHH